MKLEHGSREGSRLHLPIILIADDEPFLRNLLVSELRHAWNTIEAKNGEEVLDILGQLQPLLLLLDLNMPKKGGLEVLKDLYRKKSAPAVIVLTDVQDAGVERICRDLGAHDCLYKGSTEWEELLRTIESFRAMHRKRAATVKTM